jgi:hypothetical protein
VECGCRAARPGLRGRALRPALVLGGLRRARPRQLRARLLQPVNRRRLSAPPRPGPISPLPAAATALWRSPAFAAAERIAGDGSVELLGRRVAYPPADWSLPGAPRLRRFHLHYGDEILGWTRRGKVDAAAAGVAGWIAGNPPGRGDGWHPYPLSTRVGNWIAAGALAPELLDPAAADSLWRQLAYLGRNVEDGVLGNHVVRNAKALVLGGVAFADGALRGQGERLLRRELPEQILPDGGHYERSPLYHALVLRDLLEVRAAASADWLDEPIERMRRFAAALTRPDGLPFPFNDAPLELAPALELPGPQQGLTVFESTGYAVLRQGDVVLALDCGPPSPPFLPAHAHADALSFQLWVGGEPVVVDPGTRTYEAGPERNAFRGTRAHATVALDGGDQFEPWGAFRSGPLPTVRLLGREPLRASVEWPGATHERTVELADGVLRVRDTLHGSGRRAIASTLPLGSAAWLDRVEFTGPLALRRTSVPFSERLFQRETRPALVAEGSAELPVELSWSLAVGGSC